MKVFELLPRPLGNIFRKLTHLTCNSPLLLARVFTAELFTEIGSDAVPPTSYLISPYSSLLSHPSYLIPQIKSNTLTAPMFGWAGSA